MEHAGSCHCGALAVRFATEAPLSTLPWRRCNCGFCRRHAPLYTADPNGRLTIRAARRADVSLYRFGSRTADFVLCAHCGVLVAARCEIGEWRYGVVNLLVFDNLPVPASPVQTMDFDGEATEARLARRARTWTRAVELEFGQP